MNSNIIIPTVLSSIFGAVTYNTAYKHNIPTCDDYAKNTYLYTVTGIFIIWTFWSIMSMSEKLLKYNIKILSSLMSIILYIIVFVIYVMYLKSVDPSKVIYKNILWLIFLVLISFLTLVSYIVLRPFMLYGVIGATVISIITYKIIKQYPKLITEQFQKKVSIALIALIILSSVGIFVVKDPYILYILILMITLASIAIMTMKMLIHHSKITENANKCDAGEIKPDYVNESIGVIITVLNLILDFARLASFKKRK